ncbi:carboxylating nicotinate-nucleotide diphosphorylase, partial [Thermodesulfobacteriota bacterium]
LLAGERTALNFLQRLSGIATLTRQYADAVAGTGTRILDTRKTTPGWRGLEKEAVRVGGGGNHRWGLFDGILIKDNHIAACGGIEEAVRLARSEGHPFLKVEVEADDLDGVGRALQAGADIIMLDNMDLDEMREAVQMVKGRAVLEASGKIRLEDLESVAATGVDCISTGALTHSAPSVDISMEIA